MPYHICHIEITPIESMPRVLREADSAHNAGNRVTVIGFGTSQEYHGYSYIGVQPPSSRKERMTVTSPEMIRLACQIDADIVQLHSPELLMHIGKLKRAGKKVIFDSHEFYPLQIREKKYLPKLIRYPTAVLYKQFETFVGRHIDAVLYPCTIRGQNLFENRARRAVKIENYSMPVPPEFLPHGPANTRAVIHTGSLTETRGITTLAQAVSKTDATLILCGAFISPEYQQEVLSIGRPRMIEYMGSLDRRALFEQYGRAAIGICTLHPVGQYALGDNMSTKVYEYMQCGLPVILSDFPVYQHWNGLYHFGICVDPTDVDEIAAAITYLLDHPDEARQMGENGSRAVKEEFNWSVEEKKLLALYEEVLKG